MIPKPIVTQNFWTAAVDSVLYATIVAFFILMAQRAAKRDRPALHWITPMLCGFGLSLFSSLIYLLIWTGWLISPKNGNFFPGRVDYIRYAYFVAKALLTYGAFRLWQTVRLADASSHKDTPFVPAAPQEGVWPPPPSRGE